MAHVNDDELEQNWTAEAVDASDNDSVISAGSEDEFEEEAELELFSNKRTREAAQDEEKDDAEESAKKQKTEEGAKKQVHNSKGLQLMTPTEHFKIVNTVYAKHRGGEMTSLELADGLNESHFVVPKGLGKHKLELLPSYIRHVVPGWKRDFDGKGKKRDKSPYILILCTSAIRATEIIKHLASMKGHTAKLFGKHLKMSEQISLLAKTYSPMAVGTPARVKKLLEAEALSLKHTTHVIIDMAKDKKQLTILDLKETVGEMVELLQFYFIPRLNSDSNMKIMLY